MRSGAGRSEAAGGERLRRGLTRREFLASGVAAGAGLLVLGLDARFPDGGEVEAASSGSPELEIFGQGYPRALFFRQAEAKARKIPYERWEKKYLALNGIVGKVLSEARDYSEKNNLSFFLRYKENNPGKAVFLHYNGTGRRATDETTDFFAGHWLYYEGTTLTQEIGGDATATELRIADSYVFDLRRSDNPKFAKMMDDIAIAPIGEDGRPDWENAEQVKMKAINVGKRILTVERGAYGTEPRPFPAGSYLAAHVTTGPYIYAGAPEEDAPLWSYNFATVGPRDARGRNGGDALVDYLAEKLGPGGPLETFDGIVFDVFSFGVRFGRPVADVDVDTDGEADGGVVDGANVVGLGTLKFIEDLRDRLPDKIIMADGHLPEESQRSFGSLSGVESEGYPDRYDIELDHLSRGENIFGFWRENSKSPSINYVNFKYKNPWPERDRNTFKEPNLTEDLSYRKMRLALASAQFTDSAFTYSGQWTPPETVWEEGKTRVEVFDELWKGAEQEPNWLGMPLDPAFHLAAESPDLLEGRGEIWSQDLVSRFEGEGVAFAGSLIRDVMPGMTVTSTGTDGATLERTMEFTLPGIDVPGEDLFVSLRLRAEMLGGYPTSIARRLYASAAPGGDTDRAVEEFAWANGKPFEAAFYFKEVGPGPVDLAFEVEGVQPVYFEKLTVHSATDARYREFENGVVFANPSTRPYTFDLARLFPGTSLRRLQGSENQDPETNDGQPLGDELTLQPKDALFVAREE